MANKYKKYLDMDKLQELKEKRFRFIHRLYEMSGGDEHYIVNEQDIGKELNLPEKEVSKVSQYLIGEGLIKYRALGGFIAITHEGVIEVEHALSEPDQPSYYFPPVNIINIKHMEGSQIQQGTVDSVQHGTFLIENEKQLSEFIELLKSKLHELEISGDDKSEIEADVSTIEAQIKSSRPKAGIVKECLLSIKRILERASGAVFANELLKYLPALLGG